MSISGQLTRKVFDRYHIVSRSDMAEAVRKRSRRQAEAVGHTFGPDAPEMETLPKEMVI